MRLSSLIITFLGQNQRNINLEAIYFYFILFFKKKKRNIKKNIFTEVIVKIIVFIPARFIPFNMFCKTLLFSSMQLQLVTQ